MGNARNRTNELDATNQTVEVHIGRKSSSRRGKGKENRERRKERGEQRTGRHGGQAKGKEERETGEMQKRRATTKAAGPFSPHMFKSGLTFALLGNY